MKSTNSMGKGNFEKVWRNAFEGAKLTPSDQLWAGIEAGIANDEVVRYKRGMVYYKWLAAAGILLFTGLLGYIGYQSLTTESSLTENKSKRKNVKSVFQVTDSVLSITKKEGSAEPFLIQQEITPSSIKSLEATPSNNQKIQPRENLEGIKYLTVIERQQSKAIIEEQNFPPLPQRISGVPIYRSDQDPKRVVLWAGLNVTPGYFDPNFQSQGVVQGLQSPSFAQSTLQPEEEHRTGFSMSFGIEMGVKLSDRWQLSGGIQYLNNNVQSSTNAILDQRTPIFSSVIETLDLSDSRANITFVPTELDNTFQFLSIPVQAGYLVLDKKVKVLVNAGIASDIFLKNKITALDRSLESITINPGSNAPFRSVYFNGILGVEASYEFLPRYLITLEPRYKLAISDFTRPESSYSSFPSSFGIGLGVKYIFK